MLATLFGVALLALGGCVAFDVSEASAGDPPAQTGLQDDASPSDRAELFALINAHRSEHGLEALPWSPSLAAVAEAHVRDLEANYQAEPCSLHSWSGEGRWSGCCYLRDTPELACMWDKPRELTTYPGNGYEIAVEVIGPRPLDAARALYEWQQSPPHHDVILNRGNWSHATWRAMGVAISEHYAVVWFGKEPDPAAAP